MTHEQRLRAIVHAQTEIAAARLEPDVVMAVLAERTREVTGAEGVMVELVDGDGTVCAHAVGTAAPFVGTGFPAASSLSGSCLRERRPMRSDDTTADDRIEGGAAAPFGAASMLCAPLIHAGDPVGVLTVCSAQPRAFGAEDEDALGLLAGIVSAYLGPAEPRAATVRLSSEDPLTGIGNRRAFDDRLELECARRSRDGGDLTLVLLDLDGFAAVNERHGRPVGDGVLRTAAAVLRRWTRSIDGVYRTGGDEFALLLPGAGVEAAAVLVERIRAQFADAHSLGIAASFGIAAASGDDPAGLVAAAAAELAQVKRARRASAAVD